MTDQLYPRLDVDAKVTYMLDKQKLLKAQLRHIEKVKRRWSKANTALKATTVAVTCILGGASILTAAPFSLPVVGAILGGVALTNTAVSNLVVEGITSKRKRYFRRKYDHVKEHLNKMELLIIRSKEDGQVSIAEFDQFQQLLKNFETLQEDDLKSKDVKRVHRMVKNEMRQRRLNQLYTKSLESQQK